MLGELRRINRVTPSQPETPEHPDEIRVIATKCSDQTSVTV